MPSCKTPSMIIYRTGRADISGFVVIITEYECYSLTDEHCRKALLCFGLSHGYEHPAEARAGKDGDEVAEKITIRQLVKEEHSNAGKCAYNGNEIAFFKALAEEKRREYDNEYGVGKLQNDRVCGGRELVCRDKGDVNKAEQKSGDYRLAIQDYSVAFYAYICKHRQSGKKASQSGYDE